MGDSSSSLSKAVRDNRANQLNPNNPAYWRSRGSAPPFGSPGTVTQATGPSPPVEQSADGADQISRQKQDK